MKIALYHNLTSGGSKREAFEFTKLLAAAGHHVDLYCPTTANELFLPLANYVKQTFKYPLYLQQPFKGRLPGFRKYIDLLGFGLNLQRLQQVSRRIAQDIDNQVYDFVFIHHDQIVQSPYLLRYLQTPSVYFCAEPMRQFYEPHIDREYDKPQSCIDTLQQKWYRPARWLQDLVTKRIDHHNVQYANLLLTNSYFSAESIYRAYSLRAHVVYLGVDTLKFRPLNLERQNFVLSVGAISPYKGYDLIIKSLGRIPEQLRPRLVIVGNSASAGELKLLNSLAYEVDVELEVQVDVTEEKLVHLYNQAIAVMYTPVLEPFGLVPLEAMACGTPIVAIKEGGVRESVKDGCTGFLTERIPELLAQRLEDLLTSSALRDELGRNGVEYIRDFWTWQHACERLLKVVQLMPAILDLN